MLFLNTLKRILRFITNYKFSYFFGLVIQFCKNSSYDSQLFNKKGRVVKLLTRPFNDILSYFTLLLVLQLSVLRLYLHQLDYRLLVIH